MKKNLLMALLLTALVSCTKFYSDDPFEQFLAKPSYSPKSGMMWDFTPVKVPITLTDSEGHDLLDPQFEGNWLSKRIIGSFDGETYEGIETHLSPAAEAQTKMVLAIVEGFSVYPLDYTGTDRYILYFGDLDAADKWDTDLAIAWPDGSRDVIRVQHASRWKFDGNPEFYTGYKLNGEPVEEIIIRLQK